MFKKDILSLLASQWLSSKEPACNAEDTGDSRLIPRLGRFPGGGNGNLLQYSCLENPVDRGAWHASLWGHKSVRHDLATKQQQCQTS